MNGCNYDKRRKENVCVIYSATQKIKNKIKLSPNEKQKQPIRKYTQIAVPLVFA